MPAEQAIRVKQCNSCEEYRQTLNWMVHNIEHEPKDTKVIQKAILIIDSGYHIRKQQNYKIYMNTLVLNSKLHIC